MRPKSCPHCHRKFSGHKLQVYCSKACKQSAYRLRRNPPMIAMLQSQDRYSRMVMTKRMQSHELCCLHCGRAFLRDGLSGGMTRYCSKACKQKAYRVRKKIENMIRLGTFEGSYDG